MKTTMRNTNGTARPLSGAQRDEIRRDLERERVRFDAVDPRYHTLSEALRRMDEGNYGVCLSCDERIPYDRLAVMPETLYCVSCGAR